MEVVKDITLMNDQTPASIITQMELAGGFSGREFADGTRILRLMLKGKYSRILSFPADIIATGLRGVIRQLLMENKFNLVITTCGALDHDIARTFGKYYKGEFNLDDIELKEKGYHRLGNVLVPAKFYGQLIEEKMQRILDKYDDTSISTYELAWAIGKYLNNTNSFLYWAYKNNIPVIIPGITDGAVGSQLWMYQQSHRKFMVDQLKDETAMSDFIFSSKSLGALMIGGGISKHHTIWWSQFKDGLDLAVYITTAYEYDGSLSGALTREAISWNKIKENAKHVTIHADATTVLPFMVHAALFG